MTVRKRTETDTQTWLADPPPAPTDAPPQAHLVHIYPVGPGLGSLFHIGESPVSLGRGDECDVRVNELTVSRRHARILRENGGYVVCDLNSTNGTLVNDEPITRHALADGDHIQIGSQVFRFLEGANVEVNFLEEIHRLAIIDGLTGVLNKAHFLESVTREIARSQRHHRPLSLVLFDVDNFKAINDRFGHWAGDCTLRELVRILKTSMRKEELLGRYGGDEFALLLPEAAMDGAMCSAERFRTLVENHPFHFEREVFQVTISLGVATVGAGEAVTTEELIRLADQRLYEAKAAGRNRVIT